MSNNSNSTPLTLEEFTEVNDQELTCIFAESGSDRELMFDREDATYSLWNNQSLYKLAYGALIYTKDTTCKTHY